MNFRELGENVSRFAGVLRRRGVKRGHVVGFEAQPELETVLILAALQLGASSLSCSKQILEGYRKHIDIVVSPDEQFMRELGMIQPIVEPELLDPESVIRVSFSSGTTGLPKGIPFTAATLLPRTESVRLNWLVDDPFMSQLGLETVTGILAFYWCVFNGMPYFINTSVVHNLELISTHKVRSIQTSPAKLKDLIAEQQARKLPLALEKICTAGSLASARLVASAKQTFGCEVLSVYGSTEVGAASIGPFDASEPKSLGKLVTDVEFEIVGDDLVELPKNTVGTIRYRKPSMPTEYWHSTSKAKNGFHDGWFYPGDLGQITETNTLIFEGRNDDLVNTAGSKFNLAQLDLSLAETGLFKDVASFSEINSGGETIIGIIFVNENETEPEQLISRLKELIPTLTVSKMFSVDYIPRNSMDKLNKVAIQQLAKEHHA